MCIVSTLEAAIANGRVDTVRSYASAYVVSAKRAGAAYGLQLNMCEVSRLACASILQDLAESAILIGIASQSWCFCLLCCIWTCVAERDHHSV